MLRLGLARDEGLFRFSISVLEVLRQGHQKRPHNLLSSQPQRTRPVSAQTSRLVASFAELKSYARE